MATINANEKYFCATHSAELETKIQNMSNSEA